MLDETKKADALSLIDAACLAIRDILFTVESLRLENDALYNLVKTLREKSEDAKAQGYSLHSTLPIDEKVFRYAADASEIFNLIEGRQHMARDFVDRTWDQLTGMGIDPPSAGTSPDTALMDLRESLINERNESDQVLSSDLIG